MYNFRKIKQYGSTVSIFEFDPKEYRLDVSIGKPGKLEKLSSIKGEPHPDEYVVAKLNGGFFNMNGSTEYIGTYVDEGKYYQGTNFYYPTLIYWRNNHNLSMEPHPDQNRCSYYQGNAEFAIGVPWMLIVNDKIDHLYTRKELIDNFGHPYQRNPRTLIGQKTNGNIIFVTIDGRTYGNAGVTIDQCSTLMQSLDCVIAANLDGGGSTEMIVNNNIVNKIPGGVERAIGTSFMVYAKRNALIPTTKTGTVTCQALRVRSGPGTSYRQLGCVYRGNKVTISSVSNGWVAIVYGNDIAYVSADYIKIN